MDPQAIKARTELKLKIDSILSKKQPSQSAVKQDVARYLKLKDQQQRIKCNL
jgi:hypothetical protein